MTIDEYVCDGIDKLMANAAAYASEFTEASGALTMAFLAGADRLKEAWHDWLAQKVREEATDA